MRNREEIERDAALGAGGASGPNTKLLEVLLDIRDQGAPVEVLAEAKPLSKDRVILQIDRPKVEIRLVPREEIKAKEIAPDDDGVITEQYVPVSVPDKVLTSHLFQPMEGDEEYCGVDGCHLSASDTMHDQPS